MSVVEKLEEAIKNAKNQDFGVFDIPKDGRVNRRVVYVKELEKIEREFVAFKKACVIVLRKQLEEIVETMPEALDKKYEYRDVNGLKQIRLYEFLPNLRTWKVKLKELPGVETK